MAKFGVVSVVGILAALAIAACGGDAATSTTAPPPPTEAPAEAITIDLQEQNESGQSGQATLTARGPRPR